MNKIIKRFLSDIFIKQLLIGSICLIGFRLSQNLILKKLFIWIVAGVAAYYLFKCFKHRKLDRTTDYNKVVLLVREIFSSIASALLYGIFLKFWPDNLLQFPDEIDGLLFTLIIYLITYKLLFSFLSIAIGIKLSTMLLLFLMFIPILIMIGGFDIKYWAAVTGILGIWNYVNSRDFIVYLREGKTVSDIPKELEFKWQRNKLFANLGTVIFYCSLVGSSFFEHQKMSWMDKLPFRVYSLSGLTLFLALGYLFVVAYFVILNNQGEKNFFMRLILWFGRVLRLDKLEKTISLYKLAKNKK